MTSDRIGPPPEAPHGVASDPLMTDEEWQRALEAIWALHLPPATDEEVAEATRLEALDERHRQIVAEALRRRRAMMGLP